MSWQFRGRPAIVEDIIAAPAPADAELRASRDRLQGLYNAEIRRADALEVELAAAGKRIAELELVRDGLAAKLAAVEEGHAAVCEHVAGERAWRRTAHALQARLDEVTEANQGRDQYEAAVKR